MTSIFENASKSIATMGAIFVATVVNAQPTQAASFKFIFDPSTFVGTNQGFLSFTGSPKLTGIGFEAANLSDLTNASLSLQYTTLLPLGGGGPQLASGFSFSNPTFDFNNGNLIGIMGAARVPVNVTDGRSYPVIYNTKGFNDLNFSGATFTETLFGTETISNIITGQTSQVVLDPYIYKTGTIFFEPVPEPSNVLGLAVASGLLALGQIKFFKRGRALK